jgi:putative ABC transport system substrate-binding protein
MRVGAILIGADPFFYVQREPLIVHAARHRLPAMYARREFAEAGGLMSYGTTLVGSFHQVGIYTGQILKGVKPADLPVLQTAKFEFVINLKTAKALDLDIPPTLLARADEVIE